MDKTLDTKSCHELKSWHDWTKRSLVLGMLLWCGTMLAQQKPLNKVKEYYKDFPEDSCLQLFPSQEIDQVVLIRHGQPNLNKKGWRNRKEAAKYIRDYDSVGVIPFDFIPLCLSQGQNIAIYHSPLPRAKHTARLLFGHRPMVEDVRFREFERKMMKFINMKFPLGFWVGTSRILWFIGANKKDIESFKAAKQRAQDNADFLIGQAEKQGTVILVAHGLHNKYVMKYLRKRGWKRVRKGGSGYLAINVLAGHK